MVQRMFAITTLKKKRLKDSLTKPPHQPILMMKICMAKCCQPVSSAQKQQNLMNNASTKTTFAINI